MRWECFCSKYSARTNHIIMIAIRCLSKDTLMRLKFVLALSIMVLALAVTGQEETPVPIGAGSFTGEITAGNPSDLYSIELLAGQQLSVSMLAAEGSDLDAQLFLFDAAGTLRDSDDDSAGERDAQIVFTVTESGQYLIEASRYETTE